MRLFLICDNHDTAVGMRLAGIEGCIVNDESSVKLSLEKAKNDSGIAVVLINRSLCTLCEKVINDFRKANSSPVIVEIPDRNSKGTGDSLANYIRRTVGISI